MFRSPLLQNPLVKHDEKRLKARLAEVIMPTQKDERSLIADLRRATAEGRWRDVEAIAKALQTRPCSPPFPFERSAKT